MSSRNPGRYNLHRLGWSAFEDFCMQIMRVVLGETCMRFRPGPDGGRDGWYQGTAAYSLLNEVNLSGAFVIQCKHTSNPQSSLDVTDLKTEIAKIRTLAAKQSLHYILMTNRQVTAQAEVKIRTEIEALPNVGRCLVLAETWLEDSVDAHPRLLRMVPRLYGIGDLSQIVSFVLEEQTRAVLDDLMGPLCTFVPTDSYRRAEAALFEHRFVVLVGPAASGKSAIAANLCIVNMAQDANIRVMRIEDADQFKETWSPSDKNIIYWVDDIFGETTLDEARLREWSASLDKVEAARKRGARIVFCTRDYILTAASQKLKRSKVDIINDARVRVEVESLSKDEKEQILYNHIKLGNIEKHHKKLLKKHLPMLASLEFFSPEIARRLGNKRFFQALQITPQSLQNLFENPVQHFRDVIQGLSPSEKAAMAACLHSGNALADPVADETIAVAVLQTYGVSIQSVRESLETLEGSFVKRVRQTTSQVWQLHHPSMIEALQEELSTRSSSLALYLESANFQVVLKNTTTVESPPYSRLIFVPKAAYRYLLPRIISDDNKHAIDSIAFYITYRASSDLLHEVETADPTMFDRVLGGLSKTDGAHVATILAVRLHRELALLSNNRREIVKNYILKTVEESGWSGFLAIEGVQEALPGFEKLFIEREIDNSFNSFKKLYNYHEMNISSFEDMNFVLETIETHHTRIKTALHRTGMWSPKTATTLGMSRKSCKVLLSQKQAEIEADDWQHADYMEDYWKEQQREERYESENSRFSDVDE
jgi:hypothetical protein